MDQKKLITNTINDMESVGFVSQDTLRKELPYCARRLSNGKMLFLNRDYEVIIGEPNQHANSNLKSPDQFDWLAFETDQGECFFYNDDSKIWDDEEYLQRYLIHLKSFLENRPIKLNL